MRTEAKMDET